ncbi:hypothetical protein AVEN_206399-1 [Araneus ventricosus]|uniref:Uncharacterized protein n=1 Tax=Araneus ventricosus TaxID=182803 RepID=A0A4Y2EMK3_ARAVE|nr:hypothetical protein AVEN_206399-1 [Araneus ventricosus]
MNDIIMNNSHYSLRSSTSQHSLSSSMNDRNELLSYVEDVSISEIIKRLRNIVNEATLPQNEKKEQHIIFPQVQENASYFDALRGRRKPYVILVYPAKDSSKATSVEEILKTTIRPETSFKIREFSKVKNQGVAVVFDSVKDIRSIISRLDEDNSTKEKFSHRMPGKSRPSIILYDHQNTIADQEAQEAFRIYTEDGENLRLRLKLKGRKRDTYHCVMEAPGMHFLQLKRFRKIAVNWDVFQMKEFYHVERCQF